MGNLVLVNQAIQSCSVRSLTQCPKLNLEDLIQREVVKAVFFAECPDHNTRVCGRNIPGDFNYNREIDYNYLKEVFDDFEKQENENFEENWKRNLIKELNELHTAGLSTPDYFTQDLKETRKYPLMPFIYLLASIFWVILLVFLFLHY